jgi:hypothetical protein
VRTILGPEHAAVRLLLGETINPPGNWSSYPPHRHDRHDPPREVNLEEVYLFKVDPPGGFGVQIRYDLGGAEEAFLVRDDDIAVIRAGFHPVVAASGYCAVLPVGDGRRGTRDDALPRPRARLGAGRRVTIERSRGRRQARPRRSGGAGARRPRTRRRA